MKEQPRFLTFAWWNLHNFAEYVKGRKADARRPKREEHYQAKRDRVLTALGEAFGRDYPDLLAVCEITREAADDLVGRMPKGFDVFYAPRPFEPNSSRGVSDHLLIKGRIVLRETPP